jgi:hypothetical protein
MRPAWVTTHLIVSSIVSTNAFGWRGVGAMISRCNRLRKWGFGRAGTERSSFLPRVYASSKYFMAWSGVSCSSTSPSAESARARVSDQVGSPHHHHHSG